MAYISVADAVERTGRGHTTIYRLCRKNEHTKYIMREDKKFLIDENFLSNHYAEQEPHRAEEASQAEPKQELVDAFIQELLREKEFYKTVIERKDEQLKRNDQLITGLQDRQRELTQLLYSHTRLLEEANKEVLEAARDQRPTALSLQQEEAASRATAKTGPTKDEIKTVYAVLGLVALLLTLAIAFHEELRSMVVG